jgi:hypothetical protein
MSRLKHSPLGFVRYMQMSRAKVFMFVEGKVGDRYFYEQIAKSVCDDQALAFQTVLPSELKTTRTGKKALLTYFRYLRFVNRLIIEDQSSKTAVLFFLDKDVDDITAKLIQSVHVAYTPFYTLENHLFASGDLIGATTCASSLPATDVEQLIVSNSNWRSAAAELWKDWVKICLFTRKHRIRSVQNYGVLSRVNPEPHFPVDDDMLAAEKAAIEVAFGLGHVEFEQRYSEVSKYVDEVYAAGDFDRIFKGKWYAAILLRQVAVLAAGREFNQNGFQPALLSVLSFTINSASPEFDFARNPIEFCVGAVT